MPETAVAPPPAVPEPPDPFAKIDGMFEAAKPPEPPPPKGEPTKPGTPPTAAPPKGDAPKPVETPKPTAPPTNKQLRDEYEKLKSELSTRNQSIATLEAKIREADARGKDTEALTKRLAALEKDKADLQSTVRALKHEASPEFIEKYDKPFQRAADNAAVEVEQLEVGHWVTNQETGQKTWQAARKATFADFDSIYRMKYAEAKARAKETFGEEASLVMDRYNELHRLSRDRQQALDDEKANAAKHEEEERGRVAQANEGFKGECAKYQKTLEDKYPDFYSAPAGDKQLEEALAEGWRLVDYKPATFKEAVAINTRIRMNAASAAMLQLKNRRLQEEITGLKEKLEERKAGGPGKTKAASSGAGTKPDDDDSPDAWKKAALEHMAGV